MSTHNIIDNQDQKLVDHINMILRGTAAAKFAVGYFFLSGLEAVVKNLAEVKNLRLLIGNTSSRETIEQVAEGYQRLELTNAAQDRERYLNSTAKKERAVETACNIKQSIEHMDQTDDAQSLVIDLARMIEERRLQVKVYTKGRLHSKAYIFDYKNDGRYEKGIAIVGSSNLTLSGLTHNTELNVVVHGDENHAKLTEWFEALWADATDFDQLLMTELKNGWPTALATPYDIYMKSLYALVADRLDGEENSEILWDDELTQSLADFQKTAVRQAVQMIRDNGGVFVSDVVGLGKSYIGAAVVKHFVRTRGLKPLILCPKPLEEMWQGYNQDYSLDAIILPISMLKQDPQSAKSLLDSKAYKDRDFVLIDESHNFRHHSSQRYEVLVDFLSKGQKKVCLLTATPRNRGASDVYNQIKLFHHDDITHLPIDPPNLKDYFKQIEKGEKRLQDLLVHVLIRRTRKHILRWYGYGGDTDRPLRELSDVKVRPYLSGAKKAYVMVGGRHQYFPQRELETLRYSIEDTYNGLYDKIRSYLGGKSQNNGNNILVPGKSLTYARYGLWNYVRPEKQRMSPYVDLQRAGINLRGLIRVMLFKRFESSVQAFRCTLQNLDKIHDYFIKSLDMGFVPAGDEAQKLLYESEIGDDAGLMEALQKCSGRYNCADFDEALLRKHLEADHKLIHDMLNLVKPITAENDAKLQVLVKGLKKGIPQQRGKVLIFSQYADTVRYLYENINPGDGRRDIESIYGTEKSKARMAARFSPNSNSHIDISAENEINILVASDVMSEGLNLQDCDVVVNYDLHWNPVRLIQRFGRIDRIGTENDRVWGFNFLPEAKLEKNLGLQEVLQRRIREIHETIGEDAAILDKEEQVNEEAMFSIYEKHGDQLSLFEDEQGEFLDISEAEELMRSLRANEPDEFNRIVALRDGLRSARGVASNPGRYVFCQAGKFQQLYLSDNDGNAVRKDVSFVLGKLKCSKTEPTAVLPSNYNQFVMNVLNSFRDEVRHRRAQQKYSLSLTTAQHYVLRELRSFYSQIDEKNSDLKSQVVKLEDAFKRPALPKAIDRQLNTLRRNGVIGNPLVRLLSELYHDHGLEERVYEERRLHEQEADELPRIICSEAFI